MTTHMISLPVDMRTFNRWAAERELVRRGTFDEGFGLHLLLSSTFGKGALQPFRLFWPARRRNASLYAYTDQDEDALREVANDVATPDCLSAIDLRRLRSKAMRTDFPTHHRLGFDIRVRPVRRSRGATADADGPNVKQGAEVDAFVAGLTREQPAASLGAKPRSAARRQQVYVSWLSERFEGAVDLDIERCRLKSFRRTRAVRGDGLGPEGPDAVIQGELTIRMPERFARRLRSGVGRHKAYGYGMLLLRPAGSNATMSHRRG